MVYIMSLTSSNPIYPSYKAQIVLLKANETSIAILSIYDNFAGVFSPVLMIKL